MVKHFSVDWLAQSHHNSTPQEDHCAVDTMPNQRPHVPCMVQPRPPISYDRGCVQPKRKAFKASVLRTDSTEESSHQESGLSSPLRAANCSSPISEISGYSSGYESEAAASECLSVDEGNDGEKDGAQRRVRTKFSPEQIHKLEKIFNKHKYLDAEARVKTAQKLNLSETQVRTWFQNRRMKLKREVQDLRAESFLAPTISPMLFQHLPSSIQYHGFGGQRLQYAPPSQAFYPGMMSQFPVQQQQMLQPPRHIMHNPRFY